MKKILSLHYFSYPLAGLGLMLGMCFGAPSYAQDNEQPQEVAQTKDVDPWQNFNRRMFAFNDGVDKYLLRPIAVGYTTVMPDPLERGVTNIFDNCRLIWVGLPMTRVVCWSIRPWDWVVCWMSRNT